VSLSRSAPRTKVPSLFTISARCPLLSLRKKELTEVDWLEKAVEINDKTALHHLQLGNAIATEAQKANKFREPLLARRVKTEFELAVACDPKLVDAHDGLLELYLQAPSFMGGSLEKAKEQAQIIATLSTYHGHVARASIVRHEKDVAGEQQAVEAALAAAPDSGNAWYQLDVFYQNQQNGPRRSRCSSAPSRNDLHRSRSGISTTDARRPYLARNSSAANVN